MNRIRPLALLLVLLVASISLGLIAQGSAPESRPAPNSVADATIHDLAWMSGQWNTTQGGAALEELWTEPLVNSMTGIFRWQRGEAIWLYEFMLFEQTEAGIHFHLRHFVAGSIGWETKDKPKTYKLTEIAPGRAVFENPEVDDPRRFIFKVEGDHYSVTMESVKDGETSQNAFHFTRAE